MIRNASHNFHLHYESGSWLWCSTKIANIGGLENTFCPSEMFSSAALEIYHLHLIQLSMRHSIPLF